MNSSILRCGTLLALMVITAGGLTTGCQPHSPEVVVYCALDREFSEPILLDFEKQTGIRVLAKYDVESSKTVGLANAIVQEARRPRCDLFWNNEILHSIRLQQHDLLLPWSPADAKSLPPAFRDPGGYWYGFAARARVLLVNTELVKEADYPHSIDDLLAKRWARKTGLARPLFGTTATHAAVLFQARGEEAAITFFREFYERGIVFSGNKQVAQAVSSGQIAFGLTDTDDAALEIAAGRPVTIIYPDQREGESGTLLIPNTLCRPKQTPNSDHARRLADYLLTAAVEEQLARSASNQIPLLPEAHVRPSVLPDPAPRWMQVDFAAAAKNWNNVAKTLDEIFSSPE